MIGTIWPCAQKGNYHSSQADQNKCLSCISATATPITGVITEKQGVPKERVSAKYPKYYKDTTKFDEVDVYAVHQLFNIQDPSGAIQHASKKLLLSGVRTGGKSMADDIKEARDTLTRWLELQEQR